MDGSLFTREAEKAASSAHAPVMPRGLGRARGVKKDGAFVCLFLVC